LIHLVFIKGSSSFLILVICDSWTGQWHS